MREINAYNHRESLKNSILRLATMAYRNRIPWVDWAPQSCLAAVHFVSCKPKDPSNRPRAKHRSKSHYWTKTMQSQMQSH